jgi:signal peptidase I
VLWLRHAPLTRVHPWFLPGFPWLSFVFLVVNLPRFRFHHAFVVPSESEQETAGKAFRLAGSSGLD